MDVLDEFLGVLLGPVDRPSLTLPLPVNRDEPRSLAPLRVGRGYRMSAPSYLCRLVRLDLRSNRSRCSRTASRISSAIAACSSAAAVLTVTSALGIVCLALYWRFAVSVIRLGYREVGGTGSMARTLA